MTTPEVLTNSHAETPNGHVALPQGWALIRNLPQSDAILVALREPESKIFKFLFLHVSVP